MLPTKVYEQEGEAVTDSLLIADGFEKNHNEVLKDIRLLQQKVKDGGKSPHISRLNSDIKESVHLDGYKNRDRFAEGEDYFHLTKAEVLDNEFRRQGLMSTQV